MRNGRFDDVALENQLNNRGLMNRIFGRVTRVVTKPGQMYVVGLLFGLGFDTATEVSLLIVAGGAVTLALPWYAILTLPVLFAAGMSLLDSIDGCFMNFAYGWAFAQPARKIYYNLVITGFSVAVALAIGTIELVSILDDKDGISNGTSAAIGQVNLDNAGYGIVLVFIIAWLFSLLIWRYGRVEEKWAISDSPSDDPGVTQL